MDRDSQYHPHRWSRLFKDSVAGNPLGRWAIDLRRRRRPLHVKPEYLSCRSNDDLAEYYVVRLCKPEQIFIDGGAHIGSITAGVRHNAPAAEVIMIEAIPRKAKRLARKFPDVKVLNCALGEEAGRADFFVNLDESARSSLIGGGARSKKIEISVCRLDDIKFEKSVDVIKLDLEGSELAALRGGQRLVERFRPTILFESGLQNGGSNNEREIFSWFSGNDYKIFLPSRLPHAAPPMSEEVFLDSHHYPFRSLNYFAVASERVSEIREKASKVIPFRF
ncbi:FkbM family methyltransferase [Parafrankia sp. BMG5.11]|uniref:FkbM family methyltransferase n=1 Tax=Parafrankia sp. BMG5.11 TaxID=222540 RepID=UPI001AA00B04|nr:FkbM family methyltransferase [Parafrankia sp. BMG5.11]